MSTNTRLGVILLVLFVAASPLWGQIDRGAIVGTVRDSSGAVIPNAAVTVTNKDTGVSVSTRTNADGTYQVLALLPGTYTASASASGFSKQVQSAIVIHVQSRMAVNFTLSVGSVRQEVVVTTPPELLQTETAAVGQVIDRRQIVDLPLNGRRYADLALLEPGVQKYYNAANPAPDRFSSNGNLELQNDFLLNGIDNNSNSENLQEFSVQVVQPPPDALQEFKVQTRTYSSEFGASAGAVVNATLKSGTNQFHGDLWEFVRNNVFDANTFFNNKDGVPVGHFSQNQYGGTIGGPIIKDKTFFFFDYQRFASRESDTVDSVVPTPMMQAGNFTELPYSLTPSAVAGQSGCVNANVIKNGCIDSVGSKLLALFPTPNIPSAVAVQGTPGSWTGGNNYQFATSVPNDTWSLDGRLDQQINEKNHLFGSYSYYHVTRQDPPWTSNPLAGNGNFATQYHIRDQQVALSLNTTLSNSLLNELRVGFNREYAHSDPIGVTLGTSAASQFGLTGVPVGPNTAGVPPININGLVRLGTSPWRPQWQIAQSWELLESLTKLTGKHSIVFGYQYLHKSDNFLDIESPQGQITADGIYTANGQFGVPDFLLGDIDSISFTTPLVVHDYNIGHSFYAQDTWQAKRTLTLDYGLRYELFSPTLNHQDELTNFSPANGGSLVPVAAGASGWYSRSLIHPDYKDFAPRLGFAYHPLSRVVLRGGYGIFYQPTNRIGSEAMEALNPPWLLNANLGQGIGSTTPVMFLDTGFPSNDFTPALVTLPGLQIRAQDPNQRTSYVEQTSFGPEIQLSSNMMLAVNYVGNWGRRMNRLRNANQGVVTGFSGGTPVITYPYANLNTVMTAPSGVGTHAFLELATNDGNTDYNALEVSLRRTFTHGLAFNLNYTWSHNLADFVDNLTGGAFPQNAYNYGNEMSNSPFDVENRFVSDLIWQLPVGRGRTYLSHSSRAAEAALGGWQFNTIVTAQTGSPFDITGPDTTGTAPSGGQDSYASCVGNPFAGATTNPSDYVIGGSGFFMNPASFAVPAPGQFGTCAPRLLHGPGLWDVDLSLFKEFRITESKRFELRAEFFNAFNHPNFANPSANIGSPGSFGKVFGTLSPILGTDSGGPGDPREVQLALKFYF